MATFVGISVLGGILWRRANRWGALASMLSALAANFALYAATGRRLDHWDPNVFLAALLVGVAALIGVSLLTEPEPPAQIEAFFERLQTSSDGDGQDAGAVKPLLLVNLLHPRRATGGRGWRVFREDLSGFTIAWILVGALVAATAAFLAR
jgi:Na+/proline symporter